MRELYEKENKYQDVVKFARNALEQKDKMDERVVFEIRYLLCLSLAKIQSQDALTEIQHINGPDHHFLKGFYYRQIGKADKALEAYEQALDSRENFSKAKRELVQVHIMLSDFEAAAELAKENYERYPDNPYHIHAYFMCLIKNEYHKIDAEVFDTLLKALTSIKLEVSQEMYLRSKAYYHAFYENDFELAISYIQQAQNSYPKSKYVDATEFDICTRFKRIGRMKEIFEKLKRTNHQRNNNQLVCYNSHIIACEGNIDRAIKYFIENIKNYTEKAKQKFTQQLKNNYKI